MEEKTFYQKYLNGWVLLPVSLISFIVFGPIAFIGGLVIMACSVKLTGIMEYLNGIFRSLSIGIDQLGQAICYVLFNLIMIKTSSQHEFGNIDETLSSVFGKNERDGTLTWFGKIIMWVLNLLDKDHGKKSIEEDE